MSTKLVTRNMEERKQHEQRQTPNGSLFEFLASPDETGSEICLIRGTIPPGVAVPLHSHSDVELFYVLEGSLEAFQFGNGNDGWVSFGPGEIVSVSGNTKHALRNRSPLSATLVVVTTSKLYSFFHEVTKPVDRDQSAAAQTPEERQELSETAARYGYWMGSPEENAAIGLMDGLQKPQMASSEQWRGPVLVNPKSEVDQRLLQRAAALKTIKQGAS